MRKIGEQAFVWDPNPYMVNSSTPGVPNRTAAEAQALFLEGWAEQQFTGADAGVARQVQALWTAYFELPWIVSGSSDEMLAGTIGSLAAGLAGDLNHNFSVSTKTEQGASSAEKRLVAAGLANATAIHTSATGLLATIPAARQQFFKSHILLQSAIQRYSVEVVSALANATLVLAASPHPTPASVAAASVDVQHALDTLDLLFQAERDAEGDGEWRGVYWADRHRFTNYQARRRQVLGLRAVLAKSLYTPATQIDCCQMEYAYQW